MRPTALVLCILATTLVQVHAAPVADNIGQEMALLENAALLDADPRLGGHRPDIGDTVIINVNVDKDSVELADIDTGGHGGRPGHGGYGPSHG